MPNEKGTRIGNWDVARFDRVVRGRYSDFMPRQARNTPGGLVYHVLNRSVARLKIFQTDKDYAAFERVLAEAQVLHPIRLLSYCIMPNHWHLVLWPREDNDLTSFMRWMTHTHVMRWHTAHRTVGTGPLYQGRFKAFPVEEDGHFLTLCRYVERNALKAELAERVEDWPWSSVWRRIHPGERDDGPVLHDWPVDRPTERRWVQMLNRSQSATDEAAVEHCMKRGCPFGSERWASTMVKKLQLEHTVRKPGRPKKKRLSRKK